MSQQKDMDPLSYISKEEERYLGRKLSEIAISAGFLRNKDGTFQQEDAAEKFMSNVLRLDLDDRPDVAIVDWNSEASSESHNSHYIEQHKSPVQSARQSDVVYQTMDVVPYQHHLPTNDPSSCKHLVESYGMTFNDDGGLSSLTDPSYYYRDPTEQHPHITQKIVPSSYDIPTSSNLVTIPPTEDSDAAPKQPTKSRPKLYHKSKFVCEPCNRSFAGSAGLVQHNNAHHSGPMQYRCPECGKKFQQPQDLAKHEARHKDHLKEHKCPECPKRFFHLHDMQRHEALVHGGGPYACHCGAKFGRKDHFLRHKQLHDFEITPRPRKKKPTP